MRRLPRAFVWLFWEVDPETVDLDVHADYVLERVMSRGDWAAMQWLRTAYTTEALASFLERKGGRLAPRERVYWSVVVGAKAPASVGGGRPSWVGP